jgi:peptide methionine sulfoxide reductase MsrB
MTPNGCRHCGLGEFGHFQRWSSAVGWHSFIQPTDAQRLERMRERRTQPSNSKAAEAPTSTAHHTPNHFPEGKRS